MSKIIDENSEIQMPKRDLKTLLEERIKYTKQVIEDTENSIKDYELHLSRLNCTEGEYYQGMVKAIKMKKKSISRMKKDIMDYQRLIKEHC